MSAATPRIMRIGNVPVIPVGDGTMSNLPLKRLNVMSAKTDRLMAKAPSLSLIVKMIIIP